MEKERNIGEIEDENNMEVKSFLYISEGTGDRLYICLLIITLIISVLSPVILFIIM